MPSIGSEAQPRDLNVQLRVMNLGESMSTLDQAIELLLRKHATCNVDCTEFWYLNELKRTRSVLRDVLKNHTTVTTYSVKTLAKELEIDL